MSVKHSALTGNALHNPKSYNLTVRMLDVSDTETVYVPIPYAGTVAKVVSVIDGAIGTADDTITVRNSAGASMGTLTITQSGSAAGDVDTLEPSSNNTVTDGSFITIESDGASTSATVGHFTITIERS